MHRIEAEEDLKSSISALLGRPVESLERAGGGRNSRVFKCRSGGAVYAVKAYFNDNRGRLRNEFAAISFLRANGIKSVPAAIASDEGSGIGIYEFIEGRTPRPAEIGDSGIDRMTAFIAGLRDLSLTPRARGASLQPAAEACFSAGALLENISSRLERLSAAKGAHPALAAYLETGFVPFFEEVRAWRKGRYPIHAELGPEEKVLSPSDLGFHNTLMRPDGTLFFIDFEYFGWDDPAKLISDFILHPAMELPHGLKQRFVSNIFGMLKSSSRLSERLKAVYPLFALKWCMILLNEFLPAELERRRFSGADTADIYRRQLREAEKMLSKARSGYAEFPYRTV